MRPNPLASPLHADLAGLPPIRIHVANDEMLLDDSIRFVEHAAAAGVDAHVDVGEWMVHGFVGAVGQLQAATEPLNRIGHFFARTICSIRQELKIQEPLEWPLSNQGAEGPSGRSA